MVDAAARVRGTIAYTLNADAPGATVGRLVRSRLAHARIRSIDTVAALRVPGVLAVVTGADLQRAVDVSPFFGPLTRDQPVLATDTVRYVGEPLAAVVALDEDTAARAAALVEVDYEPLEAALDAATASGPHAPRLHADARADNLAAEYTIARGDAERVWDQADVVVVNAEYTTPPVQHVALEPHTVLARVDPAGQVIVESNTQTPHHLRRQLAEILGVPLADVRVLVSTLGGAFGAKCYPEIEPIAVLLARATRRPVKMVLERDEEFVTTARQATRTQITSGTTRDGRLVAVRATCIFENGAYTETADRVVRNAARALTAPYSVPNLQVQALAYFTNSVPCGPFRAPGAAQTIWAMESHLDEIAARLDMDPLELRLRNLVASGQSYVDGGLLESICYPEMLRKASEAIGRSANEAELAPTERRGRGFAIAMKTTNTPSTSTATVKMNHDGSLDVLTSSVEMGQGATTVLGQIAASRASMALDQVRVVPPDTESTPFDQSTTSSRTTFAMGGAVEQAVDKVTTQLRELAAARFEVAPDDIQLRDGRASIVGSDDRSLSYGALIEQSRRGNLIGHGTHVTSAKPDPVSGKPGASAHYHQAVGGAEVAVDVETGRVRVLRMHVGVFVGQAINPTLCELQAEGSMAMGLGQGLFEEMVVDGGQVANANLADYLIPAVGDVPPVVHTALHEDHAHHDVHGIGEIAAPLAPPAIANAIADAVGVRVRELPITPERVLRALQHRQQQSAHLHPGETQ
jgi:CO/xanthine dehydrogenase Mo-binding subunit